jgi:hypothetical protein
MAADRPARPKLFRARRNTHGEGFHKRHGNEKMFLDELLRAPIRCGEVIDDLRQRRSFGGTAPFPAPHENPTSLTVQPGAVCEAVLISATA